MVMAVADVDIVLQPYGSFISRREVNRFDVLNKPATAMLLRVLADANNLRHMDAQLHRLLIQRGYLLRDRAAALINSTPKIGFISERNKLKATRAEIELTNRCNLKCSYCYAEVNKSKIELSTEQWIEVLTGMWRHGLRAVLFSGGEPFIRNDILRLLEWSASKFIVEINSNGYYINDQVAEALGCLNLKVVQISLDSARSEYHDSVRGIGSHQAAIAAIKRLVANGVSVQVSCVITKANQRELSDLALLTNDLGAVFKADPVTRTGFAKNIDDSEWRDKYQTKSDNRIEPVVADGTQMSFTPVCQSQVGFVAVSHGGLLKPCNMREGFFEPVGTNLFSTHNAAWWDKYYGDTQLGAIRADIGSTSREVEPYVDSKGRYVCSMQSIFLRRNQLGGIPVITQ
jgi:MoaA/NifB/PqqE/SkfB family radical SAM enzyme